MSKKMNQLNSIILEGTVSSFVEPQNGAKNNEFYFTIRHYRKTPLSKSTSFDYDIRAYGDLGLALKKNITVGRGVRIVGWLFDDGYIKESEGTDYVYQTYIVADHVEYKRNIQP